MQFARPVAAFATDRMALEYGLPISSFSPRHVIELVRVTDETTRRDLAVEFSVPTLETWREVPTLLLGIPGNGRLEQVIIALDQESQGTRPRPEHVLDLTLDFSDDLAVPIAPGFAMKGAPATTFKRILEPLRLEQLLRTGFTPYLQRRLLDRGQ